MKDAAELLVGAVARALADDRKVMLFGDSFELLQLLASAPVKELVVVSPLVDAVDGSGQTAGGAPLRMRPDWQERKSSKDLVIDLSGTAPPDAVLRVLKKAGMYLTPVDNGALDVMAHTTCIKGRQAQAMLTEGDALRPVLLDPATDAPSVTVYLAGKNQSIAAPSLICTLPAALSPAPAGSDPSQADQVAELTEALSAADAQFADLNATLGELTDQLEAQAKSLEAAEAIGHRALDLEGQLSAARQTEAQQAAAVEELRHKLAEADAAYEAVRAELAERRVDDRRFAAVRDRFETARAELGAEVAELREQLRAAGDGSLDADALIGERDAVRRAFGTLVERLVPALGAHLDLRLPAAPPAWTPDVVAGWTDAVCTLLAQRQTQPRIEVRQHIVQAPATPPVPAAPVSPTAIAPIDDALRAQLEALTAENLALRARHDAAQLAWQGRLAAANAALADRDQLVAELRAAQSTAADARKAHLSADDQRARLRAEIALRDARITDLEAIIDTHARMEGLLTSALEAAEVARDDACTEQRSLAANLRTLQAEFERLSTQ